MSTSPDPATVDYSSFGPDSVPPLHNTRNPVVIDPDARPLPMPALNTSLQLLQHQNALNINNNTSVAGAANSANQSVYVIALPPAANPDTTSTSPPRHDDTTVIDLNQSTNGAEAAVKGIPHAAGTAPMTQQVLQQLHLLPVTTTHDQLQLKLQLDQLKLAEAEARLERDIAVKERRELERKLALADVNRVEEAQLETRMAKVNLRRREEEYSTEMKEMMRKVSWYVENQSFNKAQEDLIKEQQDTIHNLRLKFQELESLVTRAGVVRTDKDKQIKILQRRNLELEETIRTRYPNSIPELIRACQPSNTLHGAEVKQLKQRVEELEGQLKEKDDNYERGISILRTEADQLRLHYQERITTMEEEMKLRLMHAQTKKVRELEKQLTETRRYYTEKHKEQEAMLSSLRRGGGGGTSSFGGPNAVTRSGVLQRSNRAHSAAMNRSSHHDPSHLNTSGGAPRGGAVTVATQTTIDGPVVADRRFQSLKKQYDRLREEVGSDCDDGTGNGDEYAHLVDDTRGGMRRSSSKGGRQGSRGPPSDTLKAASIREALLQRELMELKTIIGSGALGGEGHQAIMGIGGGGGASSSALTLMQQQVQSLHADVAIHKRLVAEGQELSRKAALEAEDRIAALKQQHRKELALRDEERDDEVRRLKRLHHNELQEAMESAHLGGGAFPLSNVTHTVSNHANQEQRVGPKSPQPSCLPPISGIGASTTAATAYLELVTERLHALEHRQKLKELQSAKEVAEIKRLTELEIQSERQKRILQVEEKNREIIRFRGQLDALLDDLHTLQAAQ